MSPPNQDYAEIAISQVRYTRIEMGQLGGSRNRCCTQWLNISHCGSRRLFSYSTLEMVTAWLQLLEPARISNLTCLS